ncbi:TPA: hypothetical protein ACVNID_004809 [Klebsiella pneumoniae]
MGLGSLFGLTKNEFVIGGVKTKLPETDDETMDLAELLARQLGSKLPTEQDVYWGQFGYRKLLYVRLIF